MFSNKKKKVFDLCIFIGIGEIITESYFKSHRYYMNK